VLFDKGTYECVIPPPRTESVLILFPYVPFMLDRSFDHFDSQL
jgi:hypothetical protein